jgi:uncharacterized membrane protein
VITLDLIYALAGLLFFGIALAIALDAAEPRRWRSGAFYGLLSVSFLVGGQIGAVANGVLVLALVALAATGALERPKGPAPPVAAEEASPAWRLFLPALTIPVVALAGSLLLPQIRIAGVPLLTQTSKSLPTLAALALGVLAALALGMVLLRRPVVEPVQAARGLMQTVGWAALLPQMLAALGAVFALSGVGEAVSHLASIAIPIDNRVAVVIAYCVGMALFTAVMGNAFAAFPVMTAGIGLPLIVGRFHGDPAIMGAIGMLSGFCGTLLTPMAANFNLVPAALLQLQDRYGVIRAQAPTAVLLLVGNTALMLLLVFPKS